MSKFIISDSCQMFSYASPVKIRPRKATAAMVVLDVTFEYLKIYSFRQLLAYISQPKAPAAIVGYEMVTSAEVLGNRMAANWR
jgi:hypothetical protein